MLRKAGIGCLGFFIVLVVLAALAPSRGANERTPSTSAASGSTATAATTAAQPAATAAPAATPEPTATPAPTATPEPLVLSGSGQSVAGPFPLKAGLARITMAYTGARNFVVKLMDEAGKPAGGSFGLDSLLANQTGAWEGEKAVRIEKAGNYLLDITASGAWQITVKQ